MNIEEIIYEGIKPLIKEDSKGKKYFNEIDIVEMCKTVSQQSVIKKILKSHGIEINTEEIKKADRSKLVRDYEYGKFQNAPEEYRDKPVYSIIEYDDDGNVIYEDYSKLKEFLEDEFLPNNITYKKKRKSEDPSGKLYPFLQLNMLVKLRLSDKEMKYTLDYLNDIGVIIRGKDSSIDQEFENYDFYVTYRSQELPNPIPYEDFLDKMINYTRTQDPNLKKEIISENLRLARWCAYKYSIIYDVNIDELSSYAYEGLIYAIDNYDYTLGIKFSTFAVSTINGYIQGGYREMTYGRRDLWLEKFLKAKSAVEKANCTTIEESPNLIYDINELMVTHFGIKDEKKNLQKLSIVIRESQSSIDLLVSDEDENLIDTDFNLDDIIGLDLMREGVKKALNTLSSREAEIISLRFGLKGGEPMTLEETAAIFGLTRERVRQIEAKAIRKLRHPNRSKSLRGLL